MSKLRPIVTVVAFVVCLGITLAATVQVAVRGIPHHPPRPPAAERGGVRVQVPEVVEEDIRETLLDSDVSKLPRDERVEVARGLEELATTGRIPSLLEGDVTEPQRIRFRRNAFALARVLVLDKATQYDALPAEQREDFLSAEIERWRPFAGLFQLALKSGDVTDEERRQLGEFLADLIRRLTRDGL